MPRYLVPEVNNGGSEILETNDNFNIYDPTAPKLQFRNWLLGLESADDVTQTADTTDSVDIDDDLVGGDDELIISETTISFFLGSALLFFAALVLVLIVVAIIKGIKHSQWKKEQEAKKAECIRKLVAHPVRSLDVRRVDLTRALALSHEGKEKHLLAF